MNDFVNYLNSTNNVGGNSTGSLAERQVKSSLRLLNVLLTMASTGKYD